MVGVSVVTILNPARACPAGTVGPVTSPILTLTNTSIIGSAGGNLSA
jgi:hypothetical protein